MRNGLRAALLADPDPVRALAIGADLVRMESPHAFTTAIIGILDRRHLTLTCASAGHPGPLVWDGASVFDPFDQRGLPLGLGDLDRRGIATTSIPLRPNAFAAFFTDGLFEWDRDVASGYAAIRAAIARSEVRDATRPAQALRDGVIGDARHADDVAILTVRCDKATTR